MRISNRIQGIVLTSALVLGFTGFPAAASAGSQQLQDSAAIRQAQEQLRQENLYMADVDGSMGPRTQQALREFQRRHNLEVTGQLDQQTAERLGIQAAEARGEAGRVAGQFTRQEIMQAQRQLRNQNLYTGDIDGIIGPRTRAALRQYQQKYNLTATGRLDPRTAETLGMRTVEAGMGEAARATTGRAGRVLTSSDEIREAQRQLRAAGLYHGRIDGVAGPLTRSALRNYQCQQNLPLTGMLTEETARTMGVIGAGEAARIQGEADRMNREAETTGEAARYQTFQYTPEDVALAQQALRDEGLYEGPMTGEMDDDTQRAIREYQIENNLARTGTLDMETARRMGIVIERGEAARMAFSPDQISEAQLRLRERNLYRGEITGEMNPETSRALRDFQRNRDLMVTGNLNRATAEALGVRMSEGSGE